MQAKDNLYSDAMDAAISTYAAVAFHQRGKSGDGERMMRERLAAVIDAYARETNSPAQGLAGHPGATESTGTASADAAVRPANSSQ